MNRAVSTEAIQQIFTEARTHHHWLPEAVSDELLKSVYELTKWGPTAVNSSPVRILFIKSEAEKEKLYPALMGSNVAQVKAAPVTAIIALDTKFFEELPKLFPAFDAKSLYSNDPAAAELTALRNSSLQGAYFMLAARALGLDVCPMSGFDNNKVDEAFFRGTSWRSNFLCNLGYGDLEKLYPRGPRLQFEESCRIV